MKTSSLKSKIIFTIIGLAIFGCSKVWGADWKLLDFNEKFWSYYDAQDIIYPSKNIVRVWVRMDYTEKGVTYYVEELGKKYRNLIYSIKLWEINCSEKKLFIVTLIDYDNEGKEIYSFSSPTEWIFIIPGSIGERLYEEVCK